MRKNKRFLCAILALFLVFSVGSVASVPVNAIVLDPVAWLYPIWQAYAMQAGVTVTTLGGDSFTQDSFTGLFNEWQAFEVSQGVQSAAQSISGFVDDSLNFVEVVAGSGSGGVLNTVLQLEAGIVGPLSRFWNWIIADKLDAPSVDSTEFVQGSGNLVLSVPANLPVAPLSSDPLVVGAPTYSFGSYGDEYAFSNVDAVLVLVPNTTSNFASLNVFSPSSDAYYVCRYVNGSRIQSFHLSYYDPDTGLYHWTSSLSSGTTRASGSVAYYANSFAEASAIASSMLSGSESAGALTIAPSEGVDVLGFPDTRDPDYVPADTNIGWNVPYDPTADTNDYLDQAYQQALDNELDESGTIDDPVTGTDEVGEVGEYVVPGLSEVFPFCLPFDVYNFLSALAADPVPPSFTCELAFPEQLGGSQYIEIDLDNPTFNQLASVLRTMELLLFIVGLAYVTRSRFIRG